MMLFLAAVVLQFFLAGLGLDQLGAEGMDSHETLGHVLELASVILLVLSFVARFDRVTIGLTAILTVLVILQSMWVNLDDPRWLRSFHVLGGVAILMGANALLRRSMHLPAPSQT
jgi:hypothetical protein